MKRPADVFLLGLFISVSYTGRQPPPLSSVLYRIISGRLSILAIQLFLEEKSAA
jgi:hypothetical protein